MFTHEEVVSIGIWPTNSEELHQVVKLTVDVSTDSYGALLFSSVSISILQITSRIDLPLVVHWTPPEGPLVPA